jgi:hypothetical protein
MGAAGGFFTTPRSSEPPGGRKPDAGGAYVRGC